jgi:hypothetical protein
MLSDAILRVIMPNVIMQIVVLLSVFQCHRYEWRYPVSVVKQSAVGPLKQRQF